MITRACEDSPKIGTAKAYDSESPALTPNYHIPHYK